MYIDYIIDDDNIIEEPVIYNTKDEGNEGDEDDVDDGPVSMNGGSRGPPPSV